MKSQKAKGIRLNQHVMRLPKLHTPEGRKGKITLDLNEGYGTLPPRIVRKIASVDAHTTSRYPEYRILTKKIAKHLRVSETQLFLTNGSDESIKLLIELLFTLGDTVVLPVPTFFIYNHFLNHKEVRIIETPYIFHQNQFSFPTGDILRAIKKGTSGVVICNPGNPIGVTVSKDDLLALARATKAKNIPFIVDEAYFEYGGFTLIPFIRQFPNIIVLRTFSKAYGLAGMRIGYTVADESVIDGLMKLRLPWNVSHAAVRAAEIVLEEKKFIMRGVKEQKRLLLKLGDALRKTGHPIYSMETNFLLTRVADAARVTSGLLKEGLLIKNLTGYPAEHGLLKNMLRITVPAKKDLVRAIRLLSDKMKGS